ncbi:virulence factor [Paenibacillus assamensis]|uniref:virulence factor n=1 Tax=Paenibacillus assamensis TaxID=311244 RepID=UPI0004083285|nr:virulence factor [Paenibacillus assamensis]
MKLIRIEPTPSPNSMKLDLDERLEEGVRRTYTPEHKQNAPRLIQQLLEIDGVKSLFHTADFIALDRKPSHDWAVILRQVQDIFGWSQEQGSASEEEPGNYSFGEAHVYVQYFRGIPMQIRVQAGGQEERIGLSERFVKAVQEVASATLIKERKLSVYGTRYGDLPTIAREVEQELEATYTDERLQSVIKQAIESKQSNEPFVEERIAWDQAAIEAGLQDSDWRKRYAALEQLEPEAANLPLLEKLIEDEHSQIRRQVVVYLGEIKTDEVMPLLIHALKDASVSVRRTAGDTLSDIGDIQAMEPMITALKDKNKLVRWRAARYLYDLGDERAVQALTDAQEDTEFEVALQSRMALERIQSGEEAAGTVWQQMTRARE